MPVAPTFSTDIDRGNRIEVCLTTTHHVVRSGLVTVKTLRRAVRFYPVQDTAHLRPPEMERPHAEAFHHKKRDNPGKGIPAVRKKVEFKPNGRYIWSQPTAKMGLVPVGCVMPSSRCQ